MAKKKTLATMFEDFHEELPVCPNCSSSKSIIRSGTRKVREETVQVYFCKSCSKRFSDRKLSRTSYQPKLILSAITYYNKGHTIDQTARTMRRLYKTKIPLSTLGNWISRHQDELPFTKLRKKYDLDPNQTIKTRRLFHPQPYLFKVHTLKLNIKGKQFPGSLLPGAASPDFLSPLSSPLILELAAGAPSNQPTSRKIKNHPQNPGLQTHWPH